MPGAKLAHTALRQLDQASSKCKADPLRLPFAIGTAQHVFILVKEPKIPDQTKTDDFGIRGVLAGDQMELT